MDCSHELVHVLSKTPEYSYYPELIQIRHKNHCIMGCCNPLCKLKLQQVTHNQPFESKGVHFHNF